MVAHEHTQLRQEGVGPHRDRAVAQVELCDRIVHHVLLVVALVGVRDREAVHVVAEDALRDADQGQRVDPSAHAEGERHVRPQAELDRSNHALPHRGDSLGV